MKQGIHGALLLLQAVSLSRFYCTQMMVDLDLLLAACAHLPGSTCFTIPSEHAILRPESK